MAPSAITPSTAESKSLKVPQATMTTTTTPLNTKRKIICFSGTYQTLSIC